MGNCQAIDSATLVIQHPNGKVDKLYSPVGATDIMKMNPGHYVALLLTTTFYSSSAAANANNNNIPLRVTRIKLLRPTDTLVLGHVYRLVTSQEVMKGLWAKKQAKMQQQQQQQQQQRRKNGEMMTDRITSNPDFEAAVRRSDDGHVKNMTTQVKKEERHQRSRNHQTASMNSSGGSKSRAWQPALKSISEAGT